MTIKFLYPVLNENFLKFQDLMIKEITKSNRLDFVEMCTIEHSLMAGER